MRTGLLWASALLAVTASCGVAVDPFKPVAPPSPVEAFAPSIQTRTIAGRQLKPNLMLLVDRSASMNLPMNPAAAGCPGGCGLGAQACPATCPTRLSEVVAGLTAFLDQNGTSARLGLAVFPTNAGACAATRQEAILVDSSSSDDVDAELRATADAVRAALATITAGGDHATAGALSLMGAYGPLQDPDRANLVLLLTDGPPGCGDQDSATAAVTELNKLRVRTIVLGFGPDTASGAGLASLNAMGKAGGYAPQCPSGADAECGVTDACNPTTGTCNRKFRQLSNGAELTTTLLDLSRPVPAPGDPCVVHFDAAPVLPPQVRVLVNGVLIPATDPAGGWDYLRGAVTFTGSLCARISHSSTQQPVQVELQILKSL